MKTKVDPRRIRKIEPHGSSGRRFCNEYGNIFEIIDCDKGNMDVTIRALDRNGKIINVRQRDNGDIYIDGKYYCQDWDYYKELERKNKAKAKDSDKGSEDEVTDEVVDETEGCNKDGGDE